MSCILAIQFANIWVSSCITVICQTTFNCIFTINHTDIQIRLKHAQNVHVFIAVITLEMALIVLLSICNRFNTIFRCVCQCTSIKTKVKGK